MTSGAAVASPTAHRQFAILTETVMIRPPWVKIVPNRLVVLLRNLRRQPHIPPTRTSKHHPGHQHVISETMYINKHRQIAFRIGFNLLKCGARTHPRMRAYLAVFRHTESKLITAEYVSAVSCVIEQAELRSCRGYQLTAHGQRHGAGINFNLSDLQQPEIATADAEIAATLLSLAPPVARTEWLGNIIVRAQLQSQDAVCLSAFRGEKNHRGRRQQRHLPNLTAEFKAAGCTTSK